MMRSGWPGSRGSPGGGSSPGGSPGFRWGGSINGGVRGGCGSCRGGSPGGGSSRGGSSGDGGSSIDNLGSAACVMQRERCKHWSTSIAQAKRPSMRVATDIAAKHEHVDDGVVADREPCKRSCTLRCLTVPAMKKAKSSVGSWSPVMTSLTCHASAPAHLGHAPLARRRKSKADQCIAAVRRARVSGGTTR